MNIAPKTDYVVEAQALLLSQFHNSDKLNGVMKAFIESVQTLENDALELDSKLLDLAGCEGAQLDIWGLILGLPRLGLSDSSYLPLLQAWQAAVRGGGTVNAILEVFSVALPGYYVTYEQGLPGSYILTLEGDAGIPTEILARLNEIAEKVTAAGVSWQIVENETTGFIFDTVGRGLDEGGLARIVGES